MEIKNITELENAIMLQVEGSLNISKDTIREWYEKYCSDEPTPVPPQEDKKTFQQLIEVFNGVLIQQGYKPIESGSEVYNYLWWSNNYADVQWNKDDCPFFKEETYPEVYNYRGSNKQYYNTSYNAMQSWLMAMQLSELVPDSSQAVNTQSLLFRRAWDLGGGIDVYLYGNYDIHSDVMIARYAAAALYTICRGAYSRDDLTKFRNELGGKMIPASNWAELGFEDTENTCPEGRTGFTINNVGYIVNSDLFLPNAPEPRVEGSDVCNKELPEGNFTNDYLIDDYMVANYNMGAQTPLAEWNNYSLEKQNRIIQVMGLTRCTCMYMFSSKKNLKFNGVQYKTYNGTDYADYYCFEETTQDTGLYLKGPFSNLPQLWRYNPSSKNIVERYIETVLEIADNSRFPTYDTNYGRKRPCGGYSLTPSSRSEVHGAKENALYNVDIACIVADNQEQKDKWGKEDGFPVERPTSYPSGHSAQVYMMALLLGQMDPDNLVMYMRNAYEFSVGRSIGRAHWNSDCMYGRLFGTMCLPIINAMSGLQAGYDAAKTAIENGSDEGDWSVKLIIKNNTNQDIQSTGEIRLYILDHIGVDTYLPDASATAGALYTFDVGENNFSDKEVHCVMHGDPVMDDAYNGAAITDVRFYDYRHYNNIDAGFRISLDTSDSRCDTVLKKSGVTYVLKIENL